MDGDERRRQRQSWSSVGLAVVGGFLLVGLGATGSVIAMIVGMLVWAMVSVAIGYFVVVRPGLRELRARREAQGGTETV